MLSCVQLFATPWTVTCQAPLLMGILHVRIPEWFAIPFSRGSSWSSNQTRVSCIVGGFLTSWATREECGLIILVYYWIVSAVKASAWSAGNPGSIPGSGRFPWRRKWQPTPVLLPAESHGWRSLVGYSPWGRKESDTIERLHFLSFFLLNCKLLEDTGWALFILRGSKVENQWVRDSLRIQPDRVQIQVQPLLSLWP